MNYLERRKINFERAFCKIAECCGLTEKIRDAKADEEFQDFMLSLERFYIRKCNRYQKCIDKILHKQHTPQEEVKQGGIKWKK